MYIPSAEMGDYEEKRHRKKSSGLLYPLDEEGSYGRPPSQSSRAPPAQPAYAKRERKPKVYASYAVSSDCSMHASKLDKQPSTRRDHSSRPSIQRNNSFRTRPSPPRSRDSTTPTTSKSTLRDTGYTHNASRWQDSLRGADTSAPRCWQDSLRGRDSVSPNTPRVQRRSSTQPRRTPRDTSSSVSPSRARNISASPDRQRKSPDQRRRRSGDHSGRSSMERGGPRRSSMERGGPRRSSMERGGPRRSSMERGGPSRSSMERSGPRSSTDWGYTNFTTFTANRKSIDNSSYGVGVRKVSDDRKSSTTSQRKGSSSGGAGRRPSSSLDTFSQDRRASANESFRDYSGAEDFSSRNDYSAVSISRDYSGSLSRDNQFGSGSRGSSPTKVGLSSLKTPTLTDWDNMGILGLSSKMFNDSTSFKENYVSSSTSSFRRESVSTKVM